jgi:prenyltransferase beta subunit
VAVAIGVLALLLANLAVVPAMADSLPRHVTPKSRQAAETGLQWLADRQQESGAFGSVDEYAQNVGVTALCGLAFLSAGHVPDRGPYGETVSRCVEYILACAAPNGFIVETDVKTHGPMYGHGFATMFLAEVYGMSPREEVRDVLKRAVDLIIATQNEEGGWRYYPVPDEADISVTVCEMMALRAARNAGIAVPKEVMDRSVEYVRGCQNPDGGFRYRLFDAAESRMPRSAAAVVGLYTSGIHDDPAIEQGLAYLMQHRPGRTVRDPEYFFYGQYYAVQAAWHAGGEDWENWFPLARDKLLEMQTDAGHWRDDWIGNEYATAMAVIVLQIPFDYVPIFER